MTSFEVQYDKTIHGETENRFQEIAWATLDTALKVLRDGAARLVIQGIREANEEAGRTDFPTDENFIAEAFAGEGGKVPEVWEFGGALPEDLMLLESIFRSMENETRTSAKRGIALAVQDRKDIESL